MNQRKDLARGLAEIQGRLTAVGGKKYWRTLEELADSEAFQDLMRREFPEQASVWPDALSRRRFLNLMGASLALAGVGGCSVKPAPPGEIVPYVRAPEEIVPGKPLFYATAMTLGGAAIGLLVESHLGRPTKVEGNPDHPASLGATDIYSQASVLTLYDPERSQNVTYLGQTRTWDDAYGALRKALDDKRSKRGSGLRLLSETIVSPSLGSQIERLLKAFPEAKWHQYEPLARDSAHRAAVQGFGEPVHSYFDLSAAEVILSLDADFLGCGPFHLRYVADYMGNRRVRAQAAQPGAARMNRLYVVETSVTRTGAKADHRLAVPASQVEAIARGVAAKLGLAAAGGGTGPYDQWINAVVKDLEKHRGRCAVVAGDRQPASVHLLAHAINQRLGNFGKTVLHTAPIASKPVDHAASLRELADEMDQGLVDTLIVLGGNPVFTAPADLDFAARVQKVALRFHMGLYQDETSLLCQWHLPETHYLESWGDARAFDGTASIVQPLIEPLYRSRSTNELLSVLIDQVQTPGREIVREFWRRHSNNWTPGGDFETFWQTALHDGVVQGTKFPIRSISLKSEWERNLPSTNAASPDPANLEIAFEGDPTIYDGRFANNGWLQELPKPLTELTWDNAALMSPATAKRLGVSLGAYSHGGEHGGFYQPLVELRLNQRAVRAAAWIMPGHADDCITVYLGYGREFAGKVGGSAGAKLGFNAYALRTQEQPWFAPGLKVQRTGETYLLACTQAHHLMENRAIVRSASIEEFRTKPKLATQEDAESRREDAERSRQPLTMYRPHQNTGHKWGMAIDLTACTGCKACVVACQAENNIPVVGKDQVAAGREMHWLRVDRYISGPYEAPTEFHFQPVPCMHCENAPCEYVCPVEATVHSADGLNDMVYQRCVGTRFCQNNCPYKVRRFNFFFYADFTSPTLRQQYNPDVTVRSRGVMEKCTYCVQRIRHAEIEAQKEARSITDGEVLTACQAACPAGAIVFGDINDRKSQVRQCKETPLDYGLLADLNTQPRTTYLAALRNPNPELEA
jgi:molybdopterin-containing oxidoreductase family iron-sulfur binding subunit